MASDTVTALIFPKAITGACAARSVLLEDFCAAAIWS